MFVIILSNCMFSLMNKRLVNQLRQYIITILCNSFYILKSAKLVNFNPHPCLGNLKYVCEVGPYLIHNYCAVYNWADWYRIRIALSQMM